MNDDEDPAAGGAAAGVDDEKPFEAFYPTMEDARAAIKDYLQSRSMPYFARKASKVFYTLRCPKMKLDPPVDCDFCIAANYQKKSDQVKLVKCRLEHTCGIMLEGTTLKVESDWVYRKVEPFLQEQPNATPAQLIEHVKKNFKVDVAYKMAWKIKQRFDESLSTSEGKAFQLIQPYFAKVEQRMPGTMTVLERDGEQRLVRTFVLLKPLADALPSCRPFLSLDVCNLKSTYKGVLLVATMMDGAGQTLPLAWGTAQIEDADNWNWFAQTLAHALPNLHERSFTIFTDLGKGFETVVETHFPNSFHSYSLHYLESKILNKYKYMSAALTKASQALDFTKFEQAMSTIATENKKVHAYLRRIPAERWTTCYANGPKWGLVSSNAFEILEGWMESFSDISHIGLHTGLIRRCTQLLFERRTLYKGIKTVFPRALLQRLEASVRAGRNLEVVPSSETLFTVGPGAGVEVDLTGPKCSCLSFCQTGLPCTHMAAVGKDLTQLVHPSYTITSLKAVYAGIIPPCTIDLNVVPDKVTMPPEVHRPPGRPKKRQRESRSSFSAGTSVCSRCKQRGHNSRTCERHKRDDDDDDDDEEEEDDDDFKNYEDQDATV
jgi:hypothetical protein